MLDTQVRLNLNFIEQTKKINVIISPDVRFYSLQKG